MSRVYVGGTELYDDLSTPTDIEAPPGANAAMLQAIGQDVHIDFGGQATTDSLEIVADDEFHEIYVGFDGVFSALEAVAGAELRVQWFREGRRTRVS